MKLHRWERLPDHSDGREYREYSNYIWKCIACGSREIGTWNIPPSIHDRIWKRDYFSSDCNEEVVRSILEG